MRFNLTQILRRPWLRAAVICTLLWLVVLGATPLVGDYVIGILIITCYYLILATSWNVLAGYAGRFSLAQPAFATVGAYSDGLLIKYEHVPTIVGIGSAAVAASFLGFCLGLVVYRMRGTYLALTTWAFSISLQLSLIAFYGFTGGDIGLFMPSLFGQISDIQPYFYAFLALTTVAVMSMYFVIESPMGRILRAIRDDELRAATLGVDTERWKIAVFVLTSFWSGLAGAFYGHYIIVVSPIMDDFSEMSKVIAMVLVGGFGSFVGPLVGVPLLQALSTYLQGYGQLDLLIYAAVVLLVMRGYRDGVVALTVRGGAKVSSAWKSRRPNG